MNNNPEFVMRILNHEADLSSVLIAQIEKEIAGIINLEA
jgi:hypothetical protein